ncbi:FkbM family methyltransferase [Candidatus Pelagibacter bacterium]|nr:FkbM family methyltransferase [Candidatus Pelagibacter bacterium]
MIYIGKRKLGTFFQRIIKVENYFALINFFRVHRNPIKSFLKEIFSFGNYPLKLFFNTPIGVKFATIYSADDFSTFNLIFCRKDYLISDRDRVILDIGSNIGLSSLYWLTRNNENIVYCYEPGSQNFNRLKRNLKEFKSRVFLKKEAVSNRNFESFLKIEETGVYNSLTLKTKKNRNGKFEKCKVRDINSCIKKIILKHKKIDMIKVDNEGEESKTISSIDKKYWKYINCINIDGKIVSKYIPKNFKLTKWGSAQRYTSYEK